MARLDAEIEEIKNNKVYENAFEWRFEFPETLNNAGDFVGFDIVIANPPYVRQEEISPQKNAIQQSCPAAFTSTADLYVYFYERGLQIIRPGGYLSYISSNKFFRANYGEKLRRHLTENTELLQIIDFGDAPVFNAAAYPAIVVACKNPADSSTGISLSAESKTTPAQTAGNPVRALAWQPGPFMAEFEQVFRQESFEIPQHSLPASGWRLEQPAVLHLLDKLRDLGTPLGEYVDQRFYRGVLTGFNEAFVIDRATRDRLIAEDPNSAAVIKPFLRGRDVKRWGVKFAEKYLITIESSENKKHPWSGKSEQEAEQIFKQAHPAIYNWFLQYRDQLIKRYDQGKYWWELRACKYWEEFGKPKIIYPNICKRNDFAWDTEGLLTNQKAFIIPLPDKFLLACLNSFASTWLFEKTMARLQNGFFEPSAIFMKDLPIPPATADQKAQIESLVDQILTLKAADPDTDVTHLETRIDQLVYQLYRLTDQEIKIVEHQSE